MEVFSVGGACGDVSGWQGMLAEGVQLSIWAMIEKLRICFKDGGVTRSVMDHCSVFVPVSVKSHGQHGRRRKSNCTHCTVRLEAMIEGVTFCTSLTQPFERQPQGNPHACEPREKGLAPECRRGAQSPVRPVVTRLPCWRPRHSSRMRRAMYSGRPLRTRRSETGRSAGSLATTSRSDCTLVNGC